MYQGQDGNTNAGLPSNQGFSTPQTVMGGGLR